MTWTARRTQKSESLPHPGPAHLAAHTTTSALRPSRRPDAELPSKILLLAVRHRSQSANSPDVIVPASFLRYLAAVCGSHCSGASSRHGRPALTVQAGSMSRPILERLGFRTVGTIDNCPAGTSTRWYCKDL
jgi:hypothetical protein